MAQREALQPGVVVSVVGPTASGKTELAIALPKPSAPKSSTPTPDRSFAACPSALPNPLPKSALQLLTTSSTFSTPQSCTVQERLKKTPCPCCPICVPHTAQPSSLEARACTSRRRFKASTLCRQTLVLRAQLNDQVQREGLAPLLARLEKLDPKHVAGMDTSNPQRVVRALEVCIVSGRPFSSFHSGVVKRRPWHVVSVGLDPDRAELRERIARRAHVMMEAGWLDETRALLPHRDTNALNTVGYKELFQHLDGTLSLEEAVELVITRTRQFAKRQMTWFKKDPQTAWFSYEAKNRADALSAAVATWNVK